MKKELPINIDNVMTSFSYYAFPQCILTAEERLGEEIADFSILSSVSNRWIVRGIMNVCEEKNRWKAIAKERYRRDCNGCLYRELEEEDIIEIQVHHQQYTQAWAAINLFITDKEENILTGDNDYICRFGHFKYNGTNLFLSGENQNIKPMKFNDTYKMVLHREGDVISVYAGENHEKLLGQRKIEGLSKGVKYIGIQVKHGDNPVIPWFFMNFIQLSCDVKNEHRRLEYHYGVLKHWNHNIFHYFLDTNQVSYQRLHQYGGIRLLKEELEREAYIGLQTDQYYVSSRDEYGKMHEYHQNLVYGYDDKKKAFLLVGYKNDGHLVKTTISYQGMKKSILNKPEEMAEIIQYQQDSYWYLFDSSYVKKMLTQYLEGTNSSEAYLNLAPKVERVYGLPLYNELMSKKGMDVLISDRRVGHLLWEHKKCMSERIVYLANSNIISKQVGADVYKKMRDIEDMVFDLKNMCLKYQIRPEKRKDKRIVEYLEKIQEQEKDCIQEMLAHWGK